MLFLAFAFNVSPLVFKHRLVLTCLFCVKTLICVSFAVLVTVVSYGLTLLSVMMTYRYGQPLADALYAFAFALATFLAVCAGTIVMPRWLVWGFVPAAGGFAAMFPMCLFLRHGLSGDWRADFIVYLVSSLAGAAAATRVISPGTCRQPVRNLGLA